MSAAEGCDDLRIQVKLAEFQLNILTKYDDLC